MAISSIEALKRNEEALRRDNLVLKAQSGESEAKEQLFGEVINLLDRFFNAKLRNRPGEVDDLISGACIKVVENFERFKLRPGIRFDSWVYQIAQNLLIDYFRSGRRKKQTIQLELVNWKLRDQGQEDQLQRVSDGDNLEDLKRLGLMHLQAEIIYQRFFQNCSVDEIANLHRLNKGAVCKAQHLGIARLRKKFGENRLAIIDSL